MSFLAALTGAIPVALIAAVCIPFLAMEMGVPFLQTVLNPETFTDLIENIISNPELQPETLIENLKEMIQATLEMQ